MTNTTRTTKARVNRDLAQIGRIYHDEIPLDQIFCILRQAGLQPIDIDGTPWSGIICGSDARTRIQIRGQRFSLELAWFTMPSGRYEITAYLS